MALTGVKGAGGDIWSCGTVPELGLSPGLPSSLLLRVRVCLCVKPEGDSAQSVRALLMNHCPRLESRSR